MTSSRPGIEKTHIQVEKEKKYPELSDDDQIMVKLYYKEK